MHNIEDIEQQWKDYRLRKIILSIAFIIAMVAIVLAGVYFSIVKNYFAVGNLGSTSSELIKSIFLQNEEKANSELTIQHIDAQAIRAEKKKHILIETKKMDEKDIAEDIESGFEISQDKRDSLFLAKYYYDKAEYAKAEKWAFETNKLDHNIEESWLIFAKAQAKQGRRIDALRILKAYLEQTDSRKARSLMDNIRRGKSF